MYVLLGGQIGQSGACGSEVGLTLFELCLVIRRVDLHQQITLMHGQEIRHVDADDVTRDLRCERRHVSGDIGVVG